jgi:hypothetical protein
MKIITLVMLVLGALACSTDNGSFIPPDSSSDSSLCSPPCAEGETCCVNVCADLMTDPTNCGQCGYRCGAGEFCIDGVCKTCGGSTCAENEICCAEDCVDPLTSDLHCGECFNTCPEGEQCVDGHCIGPGTCDDCEPPYMCCDGWCLNVTRDMDNCGECGVVCDTEVSDRCAGGVCMCHSEAECSGGNKCCDTGCVDVSSDSNNCGDCSIACGAGQDCAMGRCRCGGMVCEFGEVCCPETGCTNILTDMANCGECDYSCDDRADHCLDGECLCGSNPECSRGFFVGECVIDIGTPPERCCSGHCRDVDEDNCENCGHSCPSGQDCLSRMNYMVWECEYYCGTTE